MPEGWTVWVLDSEGAVRVGRGICSATGAAASVALAIVLTNLIRGRAVPGVTILLVVGIPTLVAGQLWAVAILLGRRNRAEGGPTSPTPRCRYRLVDHGVYSCVSRSTYFAAGAAQQRFAAGIPGGFFVIQFDLAAGELRRRRTAAPAALADPFRRLEEDGELSKVLVAQSRVRRHRRAGNGARRAPQMPDLERDAEVA